MRMSKKLPPGLPGAKHLINQYYTPSLCVGDHCDDQTANRDNTGTLIIEEFSRVPSPIKPHKLLGVGVVLGKVELQRKANRAGGKWVPPHQVWNLHYDQEGAPGLEIQLEQRKVSNTRSHGKPKSLYYQKPKSF